MWWQVTKGSGRFAYVCVCVGTSIQMVQDSMDLLMFAIFIMNLPHCVMCSVCVHNIYKAAD